MGLGHVLARSGPNVVGGGCSPAPPPVVWKVGGPRGGLKCDRGAGFELGYVVAGGVEGAVAILQPKCDRVAKSELRFVRVRLGPPQGAGTIPLGGAGARGPQSGMYVCMHKTHYLAATFICWLKVVLWKASNTCAA